jgi:hypothetical protein
MSISVVQHANATNGLATTWNVILGAGPTEGNLLIGLTWHDESAGDAEVAPSGYTRLATFNSFLGAFSYRASVWGKFAGPAESTTTQFNNGEVNRRAHGWMVEFSGVLFSTLHGTDLAPSVGAERDPAGTSLQVGPIEIPAALLGIAISGVDGTSPSAKPNWTADPDMTDIGIGLSVNFVASGISFVEGAGQTISPTATWSSNRRGVQILAVVGVPPPGSTVLKGSSFRVTPAS